MDIMKALRELLSRAEAETETVPNDGMSADAADTETMPPAIDGADEADQGAEAGNGDSTADQAADDTEAETLPGSEVSESELRDALNTLGAENEALRTRIAELGGEAELGDNEPEADSDADDDDIDDDSDDYDDDKATADIDKQKQEIAALRGDK